MTRHTFIKSSILLSLLALVLSCGDGAALLEAENLDEKKPTQKQEPLPPKPEDKKLPEKDCPTCPEKCDTTEADKALKEAKELETKMRLYLIEMDRDKEDLKKIYADKQRLSNKELDWEKLEKASTEFLKIQEPRKESQSELEYGFLLRNRAGKLSSLIVFLDYEKANLKEACYSEDVLEIQESCVPEYYGYLTHLTTKSR